MLLILVLSGCGILEGDFFGREFGDTPEETGKSPSEELENVESTEVKEISEEEQADVGQEQVTDLVLPEITAEDQELDEMRYNFMEAIRYFDDEAYIIAEYYFLKIKDSYLILQDHIYYYMAKSLLMQKKYDQSETYYNKVLQNFPDSVWQEKSVLESADLYYLREDFTGAEEKYNYFISLYPSSDYLPYSVYQLAVCMEKNGRPTDAFLYYQKLWLEYPASEYAGRAYLEIERLENNGAIAKFSPSMEDLYSRGEALFQAYLYQDAVEQFQNLINIYPRNSFTAEIYSNSCFRLGMSYYNMAEYGKALDWLLLCYKEAPSSSIAHAALFFLGRTYTNLDNLTKAISYYEKLLNEYPSSSYGDDALYRLGRIYSIEDKVQKAIENFGRVFDEYPLEDKTDEALWELGWIQYKSEDWSSAKKNFSDMASLFSDTFLQEKALYWQAKCHIRLGEEDAALELCTQIIGLANYSYYTFAAQELASTLGNPVNIPGINTDLFPNSPLTETFLPGVFENLNRDISNIDGWLDHITKALELIRLGFYNSAAIEISLGKDILEQDPERVLEIATLFYNAEDYANSLKLIYKNFGNIKSGLSGDHMSYAYYLYYPYGHRAIIDKYSLEYAIDPLLALAVIRQESNFMTDAGSYAGALGLMQIMPSTGESIARKIGLEEFEEGMLYDPEINIEMGINYLDQQLNNFDQNLIYCLGAYNGGPGSMSSWIYRFGDKSSDEFIEHITFLETKEYIKKVIGNYYFYGMLYP